MTTLVIAKYGNFNNGVLLTNAAYDVALAVRTAQTYGLSVRNADVTSGQFKSGYGVHFSDYQGSWNDDLNENQVIVFFADIPPSEGGGTEGVYDSEDPVVSTYVLKQGIVVRGFCFDADEETCSPEGDTLDVVFKRPNPDAVITHDSDVASDSYVEIVLGSTDGSVRSVIVRSNGQIAVKN
jgi:hypothetical protein